MFYKSFKNILNHPLINYCKPIRTLFRGAVGCSCFVCYTSSEYFCLPLVDILEITL